MPTRSKPKVRARRGQTAPRLPTGEGAERTCVVTRESGLASALVRVLVGPDGTIEVDYHARLGGRGAWLMPRREVVAAAEARPAILQRALQVDTCSTAGLLDRIRAANERAVADLLSLAARSGAIASGGDQVEGAVRAGGLLGLLVASDASPKSVEHATATSGLESWVLPWDRETLGKRIGKGPRAIVALRPAGVTRALVGQLRRMQDLR